MLAYNWECENCPIYRVAGCPLFRGCLSIEVQSGLSQLSVISWVSVKLGSTAGLFLREMWFVDHACIHFRHYIHACNPRFGNPGYRPDTYAICCCSFVMHFIRLKINFFLNTAAVHDCNCAVIQVFAGRLRE